MKNSKKIYKLNLFAAIIFSFALISFALPASAESASGTKSEAASNYSVLINDLSQKLKNDLGENNLQVKIEAVEETRLANNIVEVKGKAFCVLPKDKTQLPINFEAKLDAAKASVADVQYVFVESDYAPTADEEILMRELMKQVSRDYKTDQITIAIDGFEANEAANSQKNLKGIGEIKIGEVEWNKINFDVVLGADKKAKKIVYVIE
jgi:hypothetical protein